MFLKRDKRVDPRKPDGADENFPALEAEIEGENSQSDGTLRFSVVDINDNGMGITCSQQLKVGQALNFTSEGQDWDLPARGVVMWTFKASDGFRAGIKFL